MPPPKFPLTFFSSSNLPEIEKLGLFSASGVDLVSLFAAIAARPNPVITLGGVDDQCAFIVVDLKDDSPIVYCSETFTKMTGYTINEIYGRNCRFLQSPNGVVPKGSVRTYTDMGIVSQMKHAIEQRKEFQVSLLNYKKDGSPFVNLFTAIPINLVPPFQGEPTHYVGFQVDMISQPATLLDRMQSGLYTVNYSLPREKLQTTSISPSLSETTIPGASFPGPTIPGSSFPGPTIPGSSFPGTTSLGASGTTIPGASFPRTTFTAMRSIHSHAGRVSQAMIQSTQETLISPMTFAFPKSTHSSSSGSIDKTADPQHALMKACFDSAADVIHIISGRGKIQFTSSSRILEYEDEDILEHMVDDFIHPADAIMFHRELRILASVAKGGRNESFEMMLRFKRKHLGWIWLETIGTNLYMDRHRGVVLYHRTKNLGSIPEPLLQLDAAESTWFKCSRHGLILWCSDTRADWQSRSIKDFLDSQEARAIVDGALSWLRKHTVQTKRLADDTAPILPPIVLPVSNKSNIATSVVIYPSPPGIANLRENVQPEVLFVGIVSGMQNFKPSVIGRDVFQTLDPRRATNLQYELAMLAMKNKELGELLISLNSRV
jgi:hypothetical protein